MIQYNVYPGGVKKIVTFSYDDGHANDKRLIELFNKYGVKGTFHLNGIKYIGMSDAELSEVARIYEGHEIACHTVHHGWPANMPNVSVVNETLDDRKILEKIAGYPVIGMSADCQASATPKNASKGESQPKHFLGLKLIDKTIFCKVSLSKEWKL